MISLSISAFRLYAASNLSTNFVDKTRPPATCLSRAIVCSNSNFDGFFSRSCFRILISLSISPFRWYASASLTEKIHSDGAFPASCSHVVISISIMWESPFRLYASASLPEIISTTAFLTAISVGRSSASGAANSNLPGIFSTSFSHPAISISISRGSPKMNLSADFESQCPYSASSHLAIASVT